MSARIRYVASIAAAALAAAVPAVAVAQTSEDAAAGAGAVFLSMFVVVWSVFMAVMWLVVPVLAIGGALVWVYVLIDAATRNEWEFPNALQGMPNTSDKTMWLLVVMLGGTVGGLIYYFVVMKPYPLKTVRGGQPGGPQVPPTGPPPGL
ncbi:MAG: hypothetical protein Q7W30_02830 [Coriobacteriia bacterium]|nr:hypothetical protein [Coriobacteriia bacterium]